MYRDNEYASAGHKPVYDKAHFIAKFSAIPDDRWCVGDFTDSNGRHCALGHLLTGKESVGCWINEELNALGLLMNPGDFKDGAAALARVNDDFYGAYRASGCGDTPKARVLCVLNQLPEPVTNDIRTKIGVEEVRVVTRQPMVSLSWSDTVDSKYYVTSAASYSFTVNADMWKQPVLQP